MKNKFFTQIEIAVNDTNEALRNGEFTMASTTATATQDTSISQKYMTDWEMKKGAYAPSVHMCGNLYSSLGVVQNNTLMSVKMPQMPKVTDMNYSRYQYLRGAIINNGIIIVDNKLYVVIKNNGDTITAETFSGEGICVNSNEIVRYELCWTSTSMVNSGRILMCDSRVRKSFERRISCGFSHEEMPKGDMSEANKFAIRQNSCSGARSKVPNSTPKEIGVIVVNKKPAYCDGQFVGFLSCLSNNEAYQFRVFGGAGKGMLLNSKLLFEDAMSALADEDYKIFGNKDNIVAILDKNSWKLNNIEPDNYPNTASCYVMQESHTGVAMATDKTAMALIQKGYPKRTLQYNLEKEVAEAIKAAVTPSNGTYALQRFAGLLRRPTQKLVSDAITRSAFKFGVSYVKVIQAYAENNCVYKTIKTANGTVVKVPVVDCKSIPDGLTLIERKPSTSMNEAVVVFNRAGMYGNIFPGTCMLPGGDAGLEIATTLGGADYDGDGIFIGHDSSVVEKMLDSGYKHKTIEVVPMKNKPIAVKSYEELIAILMNSDSASIGEIISNFNEYQFTTADTLGSIFGHGNNTVPEYGSKISAEDVYNVINIIKKGVNLSGDNSVEILRRTIMETARFMAETEIGFAKTGCHAPTSVYDVFKMDWMWNDRDEKWERGHLPVDEKYRLDWDFSDIGEYVSTLMPDDRESDELVRPLAVTIKTIMKAYSDGHLKNATIGFDGIIRHLETTGFYDLVKLWARASLEAGYMHYILTDECLEALGVKISDKNYNSDLATVVCGKHFSSALIGKTVKFYAHPGKNGKSTTWMHYGNKTTDNAYVYSPIDIGGAYIVESVYNTEEYVAKNGVKYCNSVVVLKRIEQTQNLDTESICESATK